MMQFKQRCTTVKLLLFCCIQLFLPVQSACPWSRLSLQSFHHATATVQENVPTMTSGRRLSASIREIGQISATCAVSSRGYQCVQQVCKNIWLHWSLGGAPPSGTACRYPIDTASPPAGALDATATELHMALETDVSGNVACAFPKIEGSMVPAEAHWGWLGYQDNIANMQSYMLLGYNSATEMGPDASVPLTNTAAESIGGGLTMCFTRPVAAVGQIGVPLSLHKAMPMNFAAADASHSGKRKHLLDDGHLCSTRVSFLAHAVSKSVRNPSSQGSGSSTQQNVNWHGTCMLLAWYVLAPFGIIVARHKWILSRRGRLWFELHRAVQFAAAGVMLIGFIIPFTTFAKQADTNAGDSLASAHSTIGIIVMILLSLHILITFIRPATDAPERLMWNLAHWWNGRITALLAAINVVLGICLYRAHFADSGGRWIAPVILFAALYAFLDWRLVGLRDADSRYGTSHAVEHQPGKVEFVSTGYVPYKEGRTML